MFDQVTNPWVFYGVGGALVADEAGTIDREEVWCDLCVPGPRRLLRGVMEVREGPVLRLHPC